MENHSSLPGITGEEKIPILPPAQKGPEESDITAETLRDWEERLNEERAELDVAHAEAERLVKIFKKGLEILGLKKKVDRSRNERGKKELAEERAALEQERAALEAEKATLVEEKMEFEEEKTEQAKCRFKKLFRNLRDGVPEAFE